MAELKIETKPPFGEEGNCDVDKASVQEGGYIRPQFRKPHDPAVSFEEYHYYALRTRAEEDASPIPSRTANLIRSILGRKRTGNDTSITPSVPELAEKGAENVTPPTTVDSSGRAVISDEDWVNASRALRNATAANCFFLITTDIIGPFGVGFSLGTMGWGPGIALFTVFAIMATYSGYLLWECFLGLDSLQFPMKNYGDLAFRIYGPMTRHGFNILQSIQLLFSVGIIVTGNGQAISQVSRFRLCYAICSLIWAITGFLVGQVRTLKNYGWLANLAIWLNLLIMFISMGSMAYFPPNYHIATLGSAGAVTNVTSITPDPVTGEYPPVMHYAGLPGGNGLIGSLNGLMQAVYAYGGAQLFIEFMAEMARPRDFLRAMFGAEFFIWTVYLCYGSFVYYYQGQYAYQNAYQGVSNYPLQTVGNMLAVSSGIIAAGLYGNIGIKVMYNNVFIDIFGAPPLDSRNGKIMWSIIVPIYWSIAFILAAAIPDFAGLVSVVAAFAMMQFTYTFPAFLSLGFSIQRAALRDGEGFDPVTGRIIREDTGVRRWIRGFFTGNVLKNVWNVIYMLGALATAGLGAYAGIQGMIDAFQNTQVGSFTCQSPLNLNS